MAFGVLVALPGRIACTWSAVANIRSAVQFKTPSRAGLNTRLTPQAARLEAQTANPPSPRQPGPHLDDLVDVGERSAVDHADLVLPDPEHAETRRSAGLAPSHRSDWEDMTLRILDKGLLSTVHRQTPDTRTLNTTDTPQPELHCLHPARAPQIDAPTRRHDRECLGWIGAFLSPQELVSCRHSVDDELQPLGRSNTDLEESAKHLIRFGRNVDGVGDSFCEIHRYLTTGRKARWLTVTKSSEPSA